MRRLSALARCIALALFAIAIGQELRKPPEEREWHGRIAGIVPYDFRLPTVQRIREAYWNPDSPHVFTDRVLGIGWAINLPVLYERLRSLAQAAPNTGVTAERD